MRTEAQKEKRRQLTQAQKHPCIDCGKLVDGRSTRCSSCSLRYSWGTNRKEKRKKPHYCIDCGKVVIAQHRLRCKSCGLKNYWQVKWAKTNQKRKGRYIRVYRPMHHCANASGRVPEHILVWEEAHDKLLPDGWIVHHLNGIKHDNKPRNLVAMPSRKHRFVLQAKAKRIQELEALLNNQGHLI